MADDCKGNESYGVCLPELTCNLIMRVPLQHRCRYSLEIEDCRDPDTLLQYMIIISCNFNSFSHEIYWGVLVLALIILVYFIMLSCICDYFTPSLCYVSNVFGLSEPIAGVTLLAFGNATPDLITSLVGARKLGPEQIIAQVLGSGMFLTTVVVAAIILVRPFRIHPIFFHRNIGTYLIAVILIRISYADGVVRLYEAIFFILLYVSYISLFFIDAQRKRRRSMMEMVKKVVEEEDKGATAALVVKNSTQQSPAAGSPMLSTTMLSPSAASGATATTTASPSASVLSVDHFGRQPPPPQAVKELKELYEMGVDLPPPVIPGSHRVASLSGGANAVLEVERIQNLRAHGQEERANNAVESGGRLIGVEYEGERVVWKKTKLIDDFLDHINPIDIQYWRKATFIAKVGTVVISPIDVMIKLLVPCIDETIICNNWCKLLFAVQCVYLPPFIAWAMGAGELPLDLSLPIFMTMVAVGIICSAFVAMTSVVDEAPPYHIVVAVVGFFVSTLTIYLVANEVVSILNTVGELFSISLVTLSMTIIPWGNCIGDLVNGMSLARAGYSRMAFTGVYGSSLIMVLVGVGFSFIFMVTDRGTGTRFIGSKSHSGLITNIYFFLVTGCVSSLVILPTLNYHTKRCYGLYLIPLYFMFLIFAMLNEFSVIHPLSM